jgi:tRNA threonylcarbamoyladenosine biosynthesis protein TsaB
MLTLAFDTSSRTAAVSILKNDDILYDSMINVDVNHSEVLLPAIDQACQQTRIKINEIDLFVCTIGPGSFTGLRIGVSTLKGLTLSSGKPAVGVSSLAALAMNVSVNNNLICSMMDAGRGQVYAAYFRYNNEGSLNRITLAKAIEPQNILSEIDQPIDKSIEFVGDGAIKYADIIREKMKEARIASPMQQHIRASAVGIIGLDKYTRNELLDPAAFVPDYLRSADAKPGRCLFENK